MQKATLLALPLAALIMILSRETLHAATAVLTWTNNATDATATIIERRQADQLAAAYAELARVPYPAATYTDHTLIGTELYCYRVRATSAGGTSTPSNDACTQAPPTNFTVVYQP